MSLWPPPPRPRAVLFAFPPSRRRGFFTPPPTAAPGDVCFARGSKDASVRKRKSSPASMAMAAFRFCHLPGTMGGAAGSAAIATAAAAASCPARCSHRRPRAARSQHCVASKLAAPLGDAGGDATANPLSPHDAASAMACRTGGTTAAVACGMGSMTGGAGCRGTASAGCGPETTATACASCAS